MTLVMNQNDISLWEQGKLNVFAVPYKEDEDFHSGDIVSIKEPFKRITVFSTIKKNGVDIKKDVLIGIKYRSDGKYAWDCGIAPPEYDESERWSASRLLPEYAIRRSAVITSVETKPLRAFTEDDIKLMHLDYASQNNPQLLIEGFLSIKNYELLYTWWKQRYRSTLKDCDNPVAVILHLTSS